MEGDLSDLVVVAGAGGFIGGQLRCRLERQGMTVRGVDHKPLAQWFYRSAGGEELVGDLKNRDFAVAATKGAHSVYNLAADMGGMGFIENNKTACMLSVLINTNLLLAAAEQGVERFFFASSACVYPDYRQNDADVAPLKESDAYPAMPEDGYGWEKLFGERMCRHFREDFGLQTRIARYHNVYGPHGTYDGGREKAPAAICRKLVSINQLVDIVEQIAGIELKRTYNLSAPRGVNGRNSDNSMVQRVFHWEPSTKLRDGMEKTYRWIYDQMVATPQKS